MRQFEGWKLWPGPRLWCVLAAFAVLDLVWLLILRQRVLINQTFVVSEMWALMLLAAVPRVAHRRRWYVLGMGLAVVIFAWPVLRLFNHLAMTTHFPMQDTLLAHADAAIGFDWLQYARWIDSEHAFAGLLAASYTNLTRVSFFIFVMIVLAGDMTAAADFIVLFVTAAILATAIGMVFPAFGAMAHFAPTPGVFHFIRSTVGTWFVAPLRDVRLNPHHVFDISNLPGLTAFPSFHTAMGVIVLYCCRTRVWLCLVAGVYVPLMIAAAVVWGGHYFVDIIAGVALSLGLIAILRGLKQRDIYPAHSIVAGSGWDDSPATRQMP